MPWIETVGGKISRFPPTRLKFPWYASDDRGGKKKESTMDRKFKALVYGFLLAVLVACIL